MIRNVFDVTFECQRRRSTYCSAMRRCNCAIRSSRERSVNAAWVQEAGRKTHAGRKKIMWADDGEVHRICKIPLLGNCIALAAESVAMVLRYTHVCIREMRRPGFNPYAQCEEPVNDMYDAVNLAVCHQSRPIVISILQRMATLLYLAPQWQDVHGRRSFAVSHRLRRTIIMYVSVTLRWYWLSYMRIWRPCYSAELMNFSLAPSWQFMPWLHAK